MAAVPSFLFQRVVHSVKSRLGDVFVADEGYLKFKRYCGTLDCSKFIEIKKIGNVILGQSNSRWSGDFPDQKTSDVRNKANPKKWPRLFFNTYRLS
jgi:hypothetical protein